MKYLVLLTLAMFSAANLAQDTLEKSVVDLSKMLADQYAQLNEESIQYSKTGKHRAVTFTIESYGLGNNYRQFLAVFVEEFKRKDEPPHQEYGEAKFRLLGVEYICNGKVSYLKAGSIKLLADSVSGQCISPPKLGQTVTPFSYEISKFGLK